jgi:hypothetical protein
MIKAALVHDTFPRTNLMIESILTFLETPRIGFLSTVDLQGYPHTVPVWFAVDGGDIISSGTKSRARFRHILANAKGSIAIGGGMGEPEGYLIKGKLSIDEDPTHTCLNLILGRYLQKADAENFLAMVAARQEERIIFRLTPTKVIKVH